MKQFFLKQLSRRPSSFARLKISGWALVISYVCGLVVFYIEHLWQSFALFALATFAYYCVGWLEKLETMDRCSYCGLIVPYQTHAIEIDGGIARLCDACIVKFLEYVRENVGELFHKEIPQEDAE